MLAKTFAGLEEVLRDELIGLGAENVELGNRAVSFEGTLETMYKANLCCRTALKILKPIDKFIAEDTDDLYDKIREIEWSRYMTPDTTFMVEATVNGSRFTNSRFVTYRVKDGIADHFNDLCGRRPSIRLTKSDLRLDVHIDDNRVTISLNSSGEPLSKRGYRVEATEAPLNEVLAAGILLKTGWRGDCLLFDPMCGSGTFLTEAALIAANINPGIYRESFAFEKWNDFDKELFERLYEDDSDEKTPPYRIVGSDIDPEAARIARANIKSANLEDMITVECRDFLSYDEAPGDDEPGIIVTNPPYGERLRPDDIDMLYRSIGSELKTVFKGYHVWILGYSDAAFAGIGLKPSVKYPINNGGLECTLREYVMFDGSYAGFRKEGGSVRNETFSRNAKPKVKRMSDAEWERDSRKVAKKHNERKPRRDDDFRMQRDDDDNDFRPRRESDFKPRREGDFKPRREGEYKPRREGDFKPRRDGEYKPRREGDFKPRREGDFKPKREGNSKPRREGEYKPRGREVNFKPSASPRISSDRETRFSNNTMRSRKTWKKQDQDKDNE